MQFNSNDFVFNTELKLSTHTSYSNMYLKQLFYKIRSIKLF